MKLNNIYNKIQTLLLDLKKQNIQLSKYDLKLFNEIMNDMQEEMDKFCKDARRKKTPFTDTPVDLSIFPYEKERKISDITKCINQTYIHSDCRKVRISEISDWLLSNGYLKEVITNEKRFRITTKKGNDVGIVAKKILSSNGNEYETNVYSVKAQKFIISHLKEIVE